MMYTIVRDKLSQVLRRILWRTAESLLTALGGVWAALIWFCGARSWQFWKDLLLAIIHVSAVRLPQGDRGVSYRPRSISECAAKNLAVIVDVLNRNHIPYSWVPIEKVSHFRTRLAIPAEERERFFSALSQSVTSEHICCQHRPCMAGYWWNAKSPDIALMAGSENLPRWDFFVVAKTKWLSLLSKSAACEVEFFTEDGGNICLSESNDLSMYVPKDQANLISFRKLGVADLKVWSFFFNLAPVEAPRFDIDLVYTWVDGSDEDWVRERALYESGNYHPDAKDIGRFTCREELRYSLRSVAFFADFFRRIHIVTNGQIPDWLDVSNEKIVVISHRDIFRDPEGHLPTFNSHAIECNLHRIPGLAEHFVYMNDDFFFLKEMRKTSFYTLSGLPYVFLNKKNGFGFVPPDVRKTPYVNAGRNTVSIVFSLIGRVCSSSVKHSPYPQRRSLLKELEEKISLKLTATESHRFRTHEDISLPASLAPMYGLAAGYAVEGEIMSSTVRLDCSIEFLGALCYLKAVKWKEFLCLNESVRLEDETMKIVDSQVARFLDFYFPESSVFERQSSR